ncbi:sensor histidine kinase [Pseudoalteromonas phenolica]|uniref:sensor histidine kinase n=1 Tax=Pseudoalteromonas phenolica TaxID=161398 RepID=UPI00110AED7E|nr:sensor histidine kinase [Pseudoalteromonas phenolica]TMO53472.1 ATP-binding protein [Pseudoalteromonas phenolica]
MNKREKELKDELVKLVLATKDEADDIKLDYGKLIELTDAISKFDQENVRFSVDAKLVERLGEQLVAKKTTALSEIVKNAYDADAKSVRVEFINTEQPGGSITVQDNGLGMSYNDLVRGFMTISTSDKVKNPISPVYKRPKAGKKGIGRFSAQKIGKKLRLVTKRRDDSKYLCIDINWDWFEPGININSVSNKITYTSDGYNFEQGTLLVIDDVRDAWTESNIKTTFNYISNIIIKRDNSKTGDPGFIPKFYYSASDNSTMVKLDDQSEYIDAADLSAIAEMNSEGYLEVIVESKHDQRFNDTFKLNEYYSSVLAKVNYKVELLYFPLASESKSVKGLQNYLNNNGGLKFYRNGFNVAPYGEQYNDWLALDESSRRRKILPPHANTNFIGRVLISDPDGELFEETSSREGVIENEAFKELTEITKALAIKISSHVAVIREKKVTASQKGFKSKRKTKEDLLQEKLRDLKSKAEGQQQHENKNLENNAPANSTSNNENTDKHFDNSSNFATGIIEDLESVSETLREYIDEQLMYRVLASSGLAISEFTHEIQTCLTNLSLNSQALDGFSHIDNKIKTISNQLEDNLAMLIAYTDFFDSTMRSNSNREKNHYDMIKLVKKFLTAMEPTTKRRGYSVKTNYDSWDIWTKKVHVSEIMSILINLFTNSCKAIERAGRKHGSLMLDIKTTNEFMIIRFEDNGDGIPKNKWADVFAPLYTTETPAKAYSSDNEYNRGMGLGLSITEQIITEMDGEISVVEPSDDYATCIKITLPLAKESELPDYAI